MILTDKISGWFKPKADDRSPFGEFWFNPISSTASGVPVVNADSAMTLSAVFAAVRLISSHLASLPLDIYANNRNGGRFPAVYHELRDLLCSKPNSWQTPFEFRQYLHYCLELRGNAYCRIIANPAGTILQLIPVNPDAVAIEQFLDKDGFFTGQYQYKINSQNGTTKTFQKGEIWHIKSMSTDGIMGLSTIGAARQSLSIGMAAQQYGARFFANDAKPSGGWIEYPGVYKDKSQKEAIRESIQDSQAGRNKGKIMLLDHGLKYHDIGINNDDAQFLQTRKFEIDEVARWFGVPPHKIGAQCRFEWNLTSHIRCTSTP